MWENNDSTFAKSRILVGKVTGDIRSYSSRRAPYNLKWSKHQFTGHKSERLWNAFGNLRKSSDIFRYYRSPLKNLDTLRIKMSCLEITKVGRYTEVVVQLKHCHLQCIICCISCREMLPVLLSLILYHSMANKTQLYLAIVFLWLPSISDNYVNNKLIVKNRDWLSASASNDNSTWTWPLKAVEITFATLIDSCEKCNLWLSLNF